MTDTITRNIASEIEKLIIEGIFKPGQQIPNEQELIKTFQVSRNTIREAIKILISNGTLEIWRGKGTFVCQLPGMTADPLGLNFINAEGLDEYLYEARSIFEPEIARLSAIRATDDEIEILGRLAEDMDEWDGRLNGGETSSQLIEQIYNTDLEFHMMLCQMCRNPVLERLTPIIIQSISKSYVPEDFKNRLTHGTRQSTHKKIYQAVANHNPELAHKLMQTHLTNTPKS